MIKHCKICDKLIYSDKGLHTFNNWYYVDFKHNGGGCICVECMNAMRFYEENEDPYDMANNSARDRNFVYKHGRFEDVELPKLNNIENESDGERESEGESLQRFTGKSGLVDRPQTESALPESRPIGTI